MKKLAGVCVLFLLTTGVADARRHPHGHRLNSGHIANHVLADHNLDKRTGEAFKTQQAPVMFPALTGSELLDLVRVKYEPPMFPPIRVEVADSAVLNYIDLQADNLSQPSVKSGYLYFIKLLLWSLAITLALLIFQIVIHRKWSKELRHFDLTP